MTTEYTTTLRLNKPDFRDPGWGNLENDNMDNIDRAISAALAGANFTIWANDTNWTEGQIAIDIQTTPSSYWICNVSHTSAITPTTFAQDRTAHPTYWTAFLFSYRPRGAWTHDTQYLLNDITYDSTLGITGICINAHISNHAGTINDDAANWAYIVNLPSSLPASSISYNPATSGLGVTNVQDAIDAVDAINDTQNTRLTSLEGSRTTDEANIATNTSNIATLTAKQANDGGSIGDIRYSIDNSIPTGYVRMDDGTIGNALSGATNLASAAASSLFTKIYNLMSDSLAPVSSGRGANAAADFAANKTITLPRHAGRAPIAIGNGAGLTSRASVGAFGGEETHIDTTTEMPSHNHGGVTGTQSVSHTHSYTRALFVSNQTGGGSFAQMANQDTPQTGTESTNHTHTISSQGSGGAHNNLQPYVVVYAYIRYLA